MKLSTQALLRASLLMSGVGCAVAQVLPPPVPVPAPLQLPARWSYASKFACGLSSESTPSPPKEPVVKRGNYASVINIHNPAGTEITLLKKVVIASPERFPNTEFIRPTRRFRDRLPSDHAMSVDCTEIVNLLTVNDTPPTTPFLEGFIVIDAWLNPPPGSTVPDAAAELDVVTITTTAPDLNAPVNSHQITPVQGKKLPAGMWQF